MKYKYDRPIEGHIATEKYRCTIHWRNGTLLSDEPLSSGGGDTGPDPHSLLLSSLASCTLITLRMYIDRKGWDIPELSVKVNMYSTSGENSIPTIDCDIIVPGETDDAKKLRLQEIAKHCPVSKILERPVRVRTFLLRNPETSKTITYTGDDVRVFWKPELCQHSGRCFSQLPGVFNPKDKKWVNPNGASPEEIIAQVNRCPSGALTASRQ